MPEVRDDGVLDQWRALAHAAVLPPDAPHAGRGMGTAASVAGSLLLVLILGVAWTLRGNAGRPGSAAITSSPTPSAPTSPSEAAPTPRASPSDATLQLPEPGGTCSSQQLTVGSVTSAYDFSAAGTRVVFVMVPIQNTGADCVLVLPKFIGVANAGGAFQAVSVLNGGTATSFPVKGGKTAKIVLGDLWYIASSFTQAGRTPPPCQASTADVTRALFPLAAGTIQVSWSTPWQTVCLSPSHVTATVE